MCRDISEMEIEMEMVRDAMAQEPRKKKRRVFSGTPHLCLFLSALKHVMRRHAERITEGRPCVKQRASNKKWASLARAVKPRYYILECISKRLRLCLPTLCASFAKRDVPGLERLNSSTSLVAIGNAVEQGCLVAKVLLQRHLQKKTIRKSRKSFATEAQPGVERFRLGEPVWDVERVRPITANSDGHVENK